MSYTFKIRGLHSVQKYNIGTRATNDELNQYGLTQNGITRADYQKYQQSSEAQAKYQNYRQNSLVNKPEQDAIPMPICANAPAGGFYVEFDFLVPPQDTNATINRFMCDNGDTTFSFLCAVNTTNPPTTFAAPTCTYPSDGGTSEQYLYSGLLLYNGTKKSNYNITVNIMHTYLSTNYTYDSKNNTYNNTDIYTYTNGPVNYDCDDPNVYTYTPGLSIYVDGNRQAKLDPQSAYGQNPEYIHDTGDTSANLSCIKNAHAPYGPITLSHISTLGTKGGSSHNEIHCKILNGNNKGLRCLGNITIVEA
jgi:hypothetical protein